MPSRGATRPRVDLLFQEAPERKGSCQTETVPLPATVEPVSGAGHLRQWGVQ